MKKGIFIAAGVVALLALMVWADHKFPAAGSSSAGAAAKPTDAPFGLLPTSTAVARPTAAASARPAAKPGCTPPYTIDSDGVRIPKPGCLR